MCSKLVVELEAEGRLVEVQMGKASEPREVPPGPGKCQSALLLKDAG